MTLEESKAKTLRPISLKFSARYDYVIFPVSYSDIRDVLSELGFTTASRMPVGPIGMSIEASGMIGRKDNLSVDFQPERQIIGVTGTELSEVMATFFTIEDSVAQKIKTDLEKGSRFLELISQFEAETGGNPVKTFDSLRKTSTIWPRLEKTLGSSLSPFSLRVVGRGAEPNQEEWLDIAIEPLVVKATRQYLVSAVQRSRDRAKVVSFAETVEQKLSALIHEIEHIEG